MNSFQWRLYRDSNITQVLGRISPVLKELEGRKHLESYAFSLRIKTALHETASSVSAWEMSVRIMVEFRVAD